MKPSYKTLLYRFGLVIGGGIFLIKIFEGLRSLLDRSVTLSQPAYLLAAIGIVFFARILQMVAWRSLILGVGVPLSWRSLFENYTLSFLPRYIPGSVWGYLSRTEWLFREYGVSRSLSNFTSLLEILLVFISVAILSIFHFSLAVPALPKAILWISICLIPWISWKIFFHFSRLGISQKVFAYLHLPPAEMQRIPLRAWVITILLHSMCWFLFGFSLQALTVALGSSAAHPIDLYSFIFSISWLVGFLILFIPTGLGVREEMIATNLTRFTGLSSGAAALVSVFSRVIILVGELIMLLLGLALHALHKKGDPNQD